MEYSIKAIGRVCTATGAELVPGTICRSALVDRDGRLERLDFAATAWGEEPTGTIGHWRAIVPEPATAKPRRLDADELLREFENLESTGHAQVRRLRYVLALLLLQKRRFELDGTRVDGAIEYLIFIGTKGEGPFEVRDEQLQPEEIEQVQAELLASLTEMSESDGGGSM